MSDPFEPCSCQPASLLLAAMEDELGQQAAAVLGKAVHVTEELSLDRLARAVAKWLPPVAWPAGGFGGEGWG